MKKNVLKKGLKLQLHRETVRALEAPQLSGIAAGGTVYTVCFFSCTACNTATKLC